MREALVASMTPAEMMLWSAEAGALGLVVLLALGELVWSRTRAAVQATVYLSFCWLAVMLLSGLPAAIWPLDRPQLTLAQIVMGPLCAAMGSYGVSEWLSAHQRDHLMRTSLLTVTGLCLVGGPLCLLAPIEWRLPASALLAVGNLSVVLWLSVRATQLGDKQAWGLALGCLLTLPAQMGLYGIAISDARPTFTLQAAVAGVGLLSVVVTAVTLWRRNQHTRQLVQRDNSLRDPVTQLYSSVPMVQKIIDAQSRRLRTRRDGALMAILLFEPDRLQSQVGPAGMQEIYIELALRIQRHTGAVNPAGRYYDCCFLVLIETMHSPRWIRTLSLRVASSLRQPVSVQSLSHREITVTPDIGVGIVHMAATRKDVDQLLHEVQSMAEAARTLRSRAAMLDPETRRAVAVEQADLGSSWRALRDAVPDGGIRGHGSPHKTKAKGNVPKGTIKPARPRHTPT